MKNILILVGVIAILFGGSIWWSKKIQESDPQVISRTGIHWHPILEIYVKGETQLISPNIGIGIGYASKPTYDPRMKMTAVHTHDDANDGIIHLEFEGIVKKEDTKLSNFFDIWNKDINSFGQDVTMSVNGVPNIELGDYAMKDGDKIELRYE